jgi:FkbM family methyltransferase
MGFHVKVGLRPAGIRIVLSLLVHSPAVRALIRRAGLAGVGYKLIRGTYGDSTQSEAKFANALMEAVMPGDCVWDVGANVGHYTRQLAQRVGPSGCVVAFEPFHSTFRQLQSETSAFPQVKCLSVALGASDQDLLIDPDPYSPGRNLIDVSRSAEGEVVHVTTGTKLVAGGCPRPAVLKIDVEGFEEDVLWGLREELRDPACRAVFLEVHFGLLERRGFLQAPSRCTSLLEDLGFRVRWLDQSHLSASRV